MRKVVSVAFAVVAATGLSAVPALADGLGAGTATVVSVGDSAISGEAGRWAGNTNGSPSNVDALGSTAYFDNAGATGEAIHGCHRSKASEIGIGGGVAAANLACSGARTYTQAFSSRCATACARPTTPASRAAAPAATPRQGSTRSASRT